MTAYAPVPTGVPQLPVQLGGRAVRVVRRGALRAGSRRPAHRGRWSYQWITQLDWALSSATLVEHEWAPDSWTAPFDAMRIAPGADATTATIDRVQRLVGLLGEDGDVPMFVLDAGYDPIALGAGLADTRT